MNDLDLKNPDVFSGELHHALLTEGLRGPLLRRLMRASRNDAELSRIFETKTGEFRRYLRASRKPTIWNLPTRAAERLADTARVTPPREVFMTLVYVVLALMAVEVFKRQVSPASANSDLGSLPPLGFELGPTTYRPPGGYELTPDDSRRIEDWMIAELKRASTSGAWREAFTEQLAQCLEEIDLQPLLRKQLRAAEDAVDAADPKKSGEDPFELVNPGEQAAVNPPASSAQGGVAP
jgi:hypothetical protein